MTPGQKRWLEKLRDEGPQRRPRHGAYPMAQCKRFGWTDGQWIDAATGMSITVEDVIARKWDGVWTVEHITDKGREALAAA